MKHIDDFTIHRFRGMREAKLEKLGQINLLVGGNNSGKTSVLEALSLFCDPLNPRKWSSVAFARETSPSTLSPSERLLWLFPQEGPFPSEGLFPSEELFPGGGNSGTELLLSASGSYPLRSVSARQERFAEVIKQRYRPILGDEVIGDDREMESEGIKIDLSVSLRDVDKELVKTLEFADYRPLHRESKQEFLPLPVRSIHGCSHRSGGTSSQLWSDVVVADTNLNATKLDTINLLRFFDSDIEDIDIISPGERSSISVKHKKLGRAPLSTFGDGLRRVFTLASAIPGVKDGLLLVDELEIAVHSRMLEKTFSWLVKACYQFNVQLFATTHSLEAIDAMIEACKDEAIDIVSYRLQKGDAQTTTKRFDKKYLTRLREELGVDLRW
jgi:AAA domain, putative AbiEii toxin, Type IV TA system